MSTRDALAKLREAKEGKSKRSDQFEVSLPLTNQSIYFVSSPTYSPFIQKWVRKSMRTPFPNVNPTGLKGRVCCALCTVNCEDKLGYADQDDGDDVYFDSGEEELPAKGDS